MNLLADGNGPFVDEPVATETPVATQSSVLVSATPTAQVASASWVKTAIPWLLIIIIIVAIGMVVYKRIKKGKK